MSKTSFNQICNTAVLRSGAMNNKSFVSLLERLVVTLIEYKNYSEFTKDSLLDDFVNFYMLKVTKLMLGEVLPELIKKQIIKKKPKEKDIYYAIKEKIASLNYLKEYESFLIEKDAFVDRFISFSKQEGLLLDKEEAEDALAAYIEDSVFSLGIGTNHDEDISGINDYVLYRFLNYIKKDEQSFYLIYKNLVMGRVLATFVVDNSKSPSVVDSVFDEVNVFLDSGFIFNLLGLNSYSTTEEYIELISTLKNLGARLYVFDHVYNEIYNIIESSSMWIGSNYYLPSKSSKATEFFLSNKYSKEDIDEYLNTLNTKLEYYGIKKYLVEIDYNQPDFLYEANIKKMIQDEYLASGYLDNTKDKTYDIDAKSIYAIHKLRKAKPAKTIQDAKFIFVTTNRGLARVANKYNKSQFDGKNIAYALTDSFMGVLLFFTCNTCNTDFGERFLIPAVYHAFEPNKELIKKMEKVLEEMKDKGMISEADSISWKTNNALKGFVVDITSNCSSNFDETTPDKIIKHFQNQAEEKVNAANTEKDKVINDYNELLNKQISSVQDEIITREKRNNRLVMFLSIISLVLIVMTIIGLSVLAYFLQEYIDALDGKVFIKILIAALIAAILMIPGLVSFKSSFGFLRKAFGKLVFGSKRNKRFASEKENEISKLQGKLKE